MGHFRYVSWEKTNFKALWRFATPCSGGRVIWAKVCFAYLPDLCLRDERRSWHPTNKTAVLEKAFRQKTGKVSRQSSPTNHRPVATAFCIGLLNLHRLKVRYIKKLQLILDGWWRLSYQQIDILYGNRKQHWLAPERNGRFTEVGTGNGTVTCILRLFQRQRKREQKKERIKERKREKE